MRTNPVIDKLNALDEKKPDYNKKVTEMQAEIKTIFESAKPYLEKAYELKQDDYDICFALMQMYNKLGMKEKSDEFRKKKDALKR